jgi:hypothetical protein
MLYRFGSTLLGYDCFQGARLKSPDLAGISQSRWEAITREPRRYGFHATLRAPFRLRRGVDERLLVRELDTFAGARQAPPPIQLKLGTPGDFIALVPVTPSPKINQFAADCVEAFDRFRAPLSAAERKRRLAAGLSKRQVKFLERYGYPYVMDEFRFHMTLTGPLSNADRQPALNALSKLFTHEIIDRALAITAVSIAKQNSKRARFRVVHQSSFRVGSGGQDNIGPGNSARDR